MRSKCRDTLCLAAEVLAREGLQHLVRLVLLLTKPLFDAHARNPRELRSEKAAQQWHLAMARGTTSETWARSLRPLKNPQACNALALT